jgi:hypothetical protein
MKRTRNQVINVNSFVRNPHIQNEVVAPRKRESEVVIVKTCISSISCTKDGDKEKLTKVSKTNIQY